MEVSSDSIQDGQTIDSRFALGKPDPVDRATLSDDISPQVSWRDLPVGTKSLALIMVDPAAPAVRDDVNQPDRTVPRDLARTDFFHWVVIDIDPELSEFREGEFSTEPVIGGKPGPAGPLGTRCGLNDYTRFLAENPQMAGMYHGYDGPFPPWNDELTHDYVLTVYATDLDRVPVGGSFTGPDVLAAIGGHVLDSASLTWYYRIAPEGIGGAGEGFPERS